ncbi:MAG: PilZ domain-containing protein [Candidatus Omnitrophota bacterium]
MIILEILIITIMAMILLTLIIDERKHRERTSHLVRLRSYWNGANRRKVVRHNAELDVRYSVNHSMRESRSRDISTRGIGLILDEKLERNTPLLMEIKVAQETQGVSAKGIVMWCKEVPIARKKSGRRLFHTGIKFLRFTDSLQEKKLFSFIRNIEGEDMDRYLQ